MTRKLVDLGAVHEFALPPIQIESGELCEPDGLVYGAAVVESRDGAENTYPFAAGIWPVLRQRYNSGRLAELLQTDGSTQQLITSAELFDRNPHALGWYALHTQLDDDSEERPQHLTYRQMVGELDESDLQDASLLALLDMDDKVYNPSYEAPLRVLACAALMRGKKNSICAHIAVRSEIVEDTEYDSYAPIMALMLLALIKDAQNRHGLTGKTLTIICDDGPSSQGKPYLEEELGLKWNEHKTELVGLVETVGANALRVLNRADERLRGTAVPEPKVLT